MYFQKLVFWLKRLRIIAFLFLCQIGNAQSFTLNGSIVGKDTGIVIFYYRNANGQGCSDTADVKQGKFQFNGTVESADYALLDTDTNYVYGDNTYSRYLFIEPGVINIAFKDGDLGNAKITGSISQKESDLFYKSERKKIKELKFLTSSVDSIRLLLKNGSIDAQIADNKIKDLNKKGAPVWQSIFNNDLSYINKHPRSYVSLMLLKHLVGRISNDSVDMFYSRLSEKVKGSSLDYGFLENYSKYKKAIGEEYAFDKISINETAPIFAVYNANDTITLNTFKGKVLLLEFWELTCLPCLQANPQLEIIRKKYRKDDFQIIGITSTSIKELPILSTYINKNNIFNWIHVSTNIEGKKERSEVLKGMFNNYVSLGVPKSVLIDKKGRVVYKNFGYSEETIQNLELLINEAINDRNN